MIKGIKFLYKNITLPIFPFLFLVTFNSSKSFAESTLTIDEGKEIIRQYMSDREAESEYRGMIIILCYAFTSGYISNAEKVKLLETSEILSMNRLSHSNHKEAKEMVFRKWKNKYPKCFPELQ